MSEKINEMACNFCNEIMCSVCEKRTCIDSVKQAYLAGAEPREKQIAELEKENADLKNKLEHRNCLDCSNHSSKLRMRNLDLEKENAELNGKLLEQKQYTEFKCNEAVKKKEIYEREHFLLTKAKEIICEYVRLANLEKEDTIAIWQLYHKAEQFINSEVEK